MSKVNFSTTSNSDFDIKKNNVHELLSLIGSFFGREDSIKREFHEATLEGALCVLASIAEQSELSSAKKIHIMKEIQRVASVFQREAAKTQEAQPPIPLWEDRKERSMSPCLFVIENYPSYGLGLSMEQIYHHDPKLSRALHNRKARQGLDEGFFVPTKSQRYDEILSGFSDEELTELSKVLAARRKRLSLNT